MLELKPPKRGYCRCDKLALWRICIKDKLGKLLCKTLFRVLQSSFILSWVLISPYKQFSVTLFTQSVRNLRHINKKCYKVQSLKTVCVSPSTECDSRMIFFLQTCAWTQQVFTIAWFSDGPSSIASTPSSSRGSGGERTRTVWDSG